MNTHRHPQIAFYTAPQNMRAALAASSVLVVLVLITVLPGAGIGFA
jgi:hypothetical protein